MKNIYASYSPEQLENHFSQFLINSWSYSKVSAFARNEKAFEMIYIYGYTSKSSATTVAGKAYHYALDFYFNGKREGNILDLVDLEALAFEHIDNVPANEWKIQKTTPTIDDCKKKANSVATSLLHNFFAELSTYEADIKEVLAVELSCSGFLTINGVDIPLPCNAKLDLVIKTKNDKIAIVDHKSKMSFSTEEELSLSIGRQAITYVKSYEEKTGIKVDEVWFIENKYSQNRDKSDQLNCFKLSLDDNTRKLYEALLYEPLKRMIEAVNNPDYIYMINDSDNFVDMAELYDFWAKTMINEIGVEDFNVPEAKKEIIAKRLKKIRDSSIDIVNPKVIKQFKQNASQFIQYDLSNKDMTSQEKIEHVLRSFNTIVKVAHTFDGYSSNTYLLEVSAGVKIASIHSHKLDIANALNVSTVRISKDLVVHENKSYLAVEFVKKRDKDLFFDASYLEGMKLPLGKDNFGNTIVWDLNNHSTPHALICGATGSGKSVEIKNIVEYGKLAGVDEIIILDPKYEFVSYNKDPKVKVLNEIIAIEETMKELVDEMNERVKSGETSKRTLIVFDEFADAVSASRSGSELDIKDMVQTGHIKMKSMLGGTYLEPKMELKKVGELKTLEENLKILLQKGRSTGFRICAATQRASVKVITGDAKVNFPVQICFRVPKETDSRVVLDEAGAESLAGAGDGLIKSPEYQEITRFQAFYKP